MIETTTIEGVRAAVREARQRGQKVGFVPTMGALHAGHVSLVHAARAYSSAPVAGSGSAALANAGDAPAVPSTAARAPRSAPAPFVVLSIFVNPTQFAPGEDYEAYPRTWESDRAAAASAGVDLLFHPSRVEMYPPGFQTMITVPKISAPLCGRSRPGHFDGVALVVTKLINIVQPDFSIFGRKDAQQGLLIRRLAADLHLPGEILLAPTVREADGLAMSSRNVYLTPEERRAAAAISRGLFTALSAYKAGEKRAAALLSLVTAAIGPVVGEDATAAMIPPASPEPLLRPEYIEIVDREHLGPWIDPSRPALLAVAARCGKARLIDNVFLGGEEETELPKFQSSGPGDVRPAHKGVS